MDIPPHNVKILPFPDFFIYWLAFCIKVRVYVYVIVCVSMWVHECVQIKCAMRAIFTGSVSNDTLSI